MPTNNKRLNSRQCSEFVPPITSTNSGVNLKGDCSKPLEEKKIQIIKKTLKISKKTENLPKFLGDMLKMKPKSM